MKFSGRHFPKDIILQTVRWHVSYRMIEELLTERGVPVDHSTINHQPLGCGICAQTGSTALKE